MKDAARRYQQRPAPGRPSNTEEPNARVPRERVHVDSPQEGDIQDSPQGYVPSAPDPVPVYLVQPAPARRTRVRRVTGNMTLRAGIAQQIAGADLRRRRCVVRNLDSTNNVFVIPDGTTIDIGGFKLEPAQDTPYMEDTDEVWVVSSTTCDITWLLEYEVDA